MSATATITHTTTKSVRVLSAISPEFIPMRNCHSIKVLSALSPEFIPQRDCYPTPIKGDAPLATVINKLQAIPNVIPTFSKRPPISTPGESLEEWVMMDYAEFNLKLPPLKTISPPSKSCSSSSSSPSSSSPSSPESSISSEEEQKAASVIIEESFEEYKARLLCQENPRYAQEQGANAARAAMRQKKLKEAGIVEMEVKITDKEVWLWGHSTLGEYRCSDPSPLRRCMILV